MVGLPARRRGAVRTAGPRVVPLRLRGRLLLAAGRIASFIPLLALLAVLGVLAAEAGPALVYNGLGFFGRSGWNLGNTYGALSHAGGITHFPGARYGALPMIAGTLETAVIGTVVAVPIAVGAALALTQRLPRRIGQLVGVVLELLAGIPSVVIGLWGALTFGPIVAHDIAPVIARNAPDVPVLDWFRGNTGNGEGLLTSSLILAIMVIPIIAATTRDLLRQVPALPQEGARALGMSDWEVTRKVTLRWIAPGIVGAVVLGLGRALGETMAVAMVCGVVLAAVPGNLYSSMTTIAATIVTQLDSSLTDASGLAVKTLAELGLVLMVFTLGVNVLARLLVRRVAGTALPVGRGI
jgi:phosphate transport system permease protein